MNTTSPAYEINVHLNAGDYYHFTIHNIRRQLILMFFFYWCLVFIVLHWKATSLGSNDLVLAIPIGLIVGGLLIRYHVWRIKQRTYKLFDGDRIARLNQTIELSDAGVKHRTGESSFEASWGDVVRVENTKHLVLIYLGRKKAVVLPQRDVADKASLKAELDKHLPPSKVKWK